MFENKFFVFDFSHQYDYLREQAEYYSDCSLISGTNAYCSDEAAESLREEVSKALTAAEENNAIGTENADGGGAASQIHPGSINFIDSGNYHYMSLFFLERIETDFNLLLIDHHTDMNENAFGNILSCGNWVRRALETLPHLRAVFMLGVKKQYFQEMKESLISEGELAENPEDEKELFFLQNSAKSTQQAESGLSAEVKNDSAKKIRYVNSIDEMPSGMLSDLPLYISLDKDALSEKYAATDWDQGDLSLKNLMQLFERLKQNNIIGLDICGDAKSCDFVNQDINLKIISYLMKHNKN